MFIKEKQSTSAKIGVISTAWTMLVIAMLATTFSLYGQKPQQNGPDYPQLTSRAQYTNYY
jgi:predicted RND superfamily exporter protein